ncbi:MAG: dihydrofolate reductase family protein, partial [Gammaproteobacteria bacterium]|nr:dihydrofolate reductase family protein [Gammaproteobacteria bacterium]
MGLNEQVAQWITEKRQIRDTIKSGSAIPNRPMVTLSYAQAWDGSITTKPGSSLSLSSSAAIEMTHALRSWHDGILIGIDTVIADDPL